MKVFLKYKLKSLVVFVSLLGLFISGYLWFLYTQPRPIICQSSCQLLRESEFSSFLGISLPIWGTFFYLSFLVYFLILLFTKRVFIFVRLEKYIFFLLATLGFVFSIYLTYVEAFVLEAFCDWCIASAITSTLIFLLVSIRTLKK